MEEPNVIVEGSRAGTSNEPKVRAGTVRTKTTLRELIERGLVDTMQASRMAEVRTRRRHRGKGRTGNGGHPSLLNLHRQIGTNLDSRWLDGE